MSNLARNQRCLQILSGGNISTRKHRVYTYEFFDFTQILQNFKSKSVATGVGVGAIHNEYAKGRLLNNNKLNCGYMSLIPKIDMMISITTTS